jgi:hypothetical protein
MSVRTIETSITFIKSFTLSSTEGVQPPGTYRLVTDDEQIPGLSFVAFRRMATMLYLPANPAPGSARHVVCVDPAELAAALTADSD